MNTESKLVVDRDEVWGIGRMGEGEWEVQASSHKRNKSQEERYIIGNIISGTVKCCNDDTWWLPLA